nr:hypothetical protein [Sinorhizobium meliloti]
MPPSAISEIFEQTRIGAQLRHDVELAFRPVEETRPMRLRRGLEVAERLEECDLQTVIPDHAPDIGGRPVKGEKIVLEDFDAAEAHLGDGRELFRQFAANE